MKKYIIVLSLVISLVVYSGVAVITTKETKEEIDKFQQAIKVVLMHEGGYSNDANDNGGPTKYGISLRYLRLEEHDPKLDKNDIIKLTKTEADNIYLKDWWDKYHFVLVVDNYLSTKLMDVAVNMGGGEMALIAHRAINDVSKKNLPINTSFDIQTINMINALEVDLMKKAIRYECTQFYLNIIKRNPHLSAFKNGWLARANY